ncbi:hypothetical protein BYZ73_15090 [Rhodovulum viride]|uniref:TniQ domain-containing protein n=1 Tax=Rhodovulum viride TaxID=1231134 RepID=A0ABX9DDJ6_9RHOB|nr:TniQ family protein [Rhodovulum viride]RAP40404.1 hypothetical protein BYZ73_15090 [Rhodovulum viride]
MTELLRPFLPFDPAETLLSWAARLAALHTGDRFVPFLRDFGIEPKSIVLNSEDAVERLCEVTGQDPAVVAQNRLKRAGVRRFALRDEVFPLEFTKGAMTAFCPACLAEDDRAGGNMHAHRRGKLIWTLRHVLTCPVHGLPLVERRRESWDSIYHELSLLVPEEGESLAALAEGLERRAPSGLQDYLISRLEGGTGPAWLDGQGIEQAARTTEVLGTLLEFGRDRVTSDLTLAERDEACRTGWHYTSRGAEGVREALQTVQDAFRDRNGKVGPQKVFGQMFKWLAYGTNQKDVGPIRDLLREHIFDTMAVVPGDEVLGEVLPVRRRHSVLSLAEHIKVHPKTLRNFLKACGAVAPDCEEQPDTLVTLDVAEGERLAELLKNAVPVSKLPKLMNCTRSQAQLMVDCGILKPIGRGGIEIGNSRCAIDRREVEELMADLKRRLPVIRREPEGRHGLARTAELSRVTLDVILPALFDGKLTSAARLAGQNGLAAVRLDPVELARFATVRPLGYGPSEAFKILKVSLRVGRALLAERPGGPLLRSRRVPVSAFARAGIWLMPQDLADFQCEYATHGNLCMETGLHHMELSHALKKMGVEPVVDPEEIGVRVYRWADIRAAPVDIWLT